MCHFRSKRFHFKISRAFVAEEYLALSRMILAAFFFGFEDRSLTHAALFLSVTPNNVTVVKKEEVVENDKGR